jgi:hypothetical protein
MTAKAKVSGGNDIAFLLDGLILTSSCIIASKLHWLLGSHSPLMDPPLEEDQDLDHPIQTQQAVGDQQGGLAFQQGEKRLFCFKNARRSAKNHSFYPDIPLSFEDILIS